jgi:hypothetical protein
VPVEFTTGQPIQYMDSLSNGRWDLTWQTTAPAAGVTLTLRAEHPTLPITGSIQITGGLGPTQPRPTVNDNGVVSAASGQPTPVAPGGILTIYGSALSAGTGAAPVLPLPTLFNNTTVTLGDSPLPLFYTSDGLLNALVPTGLARIPT